MKNTHVIALQGYIRVDEDTRQSYMIVDDIEFKIIGPYSLRTGDYIKFVGHIANIDVLNMIDVKGQVTLIETVDSREAN